jgi:hypothetical protein
MTQAADAAAQLATVCQQMMLVIARLDHFGELLHGHMARDVQELLAEGREWGARLDAGIAALSERVSKLEQAGTGV